MTKIGNIQKIMISLDIFAEEKSFLNWPENLSLKYQALVSGHPVYVCVYVYIKYGKIYYDKIN